MIYHSVAMQKLMAQDPALASRVALWDSCGLYVRMWLLRLRLKTANGAQ